MVFKLLKKILGSSVTRRIRPLGHGLKGFFAALYFGFPARKLIVIGVTGTKGKTTTNVFTGRLLNASGIKSGYISTALTNIGDFELGVGQDPVLGVIAAENQNTQKMTTLDAWQLQQMLRDMIDNKCVAVVLEMSSQGLEQNRFWGLAGFDVGVFLNLYPEHIEAHGSMEKYKVSKSKLFKSMKPNGVFVQADQTEYSQFMWDAIPDSVRATITRLTAAELKVVPHEEKHSLYKSVEYEGKQYETKALATFDIDNFLVAVLAVSHVPRMLGFEAFNISDLLPFASKVMGVAGRMEWVVEHGKVTWNRELIAHAMPEVDVSILVDYAHEPESMRQLLQNLKAWKDRGFFDCIIHIISSDGAGRDDWKKPVMGSLSYEYTDYSVFTTDNYDKFDSPEQIVNILTSKLPPSGYTQKYFSLPDRREAFGKALALAKKCGAGGKRVLICSTGVGTEYGLLQPSGVVPWDERKVWVEEYERCFPPKNQL